MNLNSYEVLCAFANQLERNISGETFKTKVVVTPSSINEKGVVIKVSLLKTFIPDDVPASRASRTLRLRVSVTGTAESLTGLKQATEAIEALDNYLISKDLRLELGGKSSLMKVPNSRITQILNQEDSFIDKPDSTAVQDVQDDRFVIITFPQGGN